VRDLTHIYFLLLRLALDVPDAADVKSGAVPGASCGLSRAACMLPRALSDEEWARVFDFAKKQSLVGLFYSAVQKLPAEQRPPRELLLRWSYEAEKIRGVNVRMNATAARLTEMFLAKGLHPVILKGQANARLYPDPFARQAGDIDILIEGGRGGVVRALEQMGYQVEADDNVSDHHVHLDKNAFGGITVEVHFQPTSSFSPFKTRNMLRFLDQELAKDREQSKVREGAARDDFHDGTARAVSTRAASSEHRGMTPEGFCVPSIPFALVMQLSHIRQHFFSTGVGLRQLADYCVLLQSSSAEDRALVAAGLKSFGLFRMAGAVMWVMNQVFGMGEDRFICAPDSRRGKQLLDVVMKGGNFGFFADDYRVPVLKRWLNDRRRALRMMRFDFNEAFWHELRYWKCTLSLVPRRLKRGRIALGTR